MAYKRKRSNVARRNKRGKSKRTPFKRSTRRRTSPLANKVNAIYRMIETKEGCIQTGNEIGLFHNNIRVLVNSVGAELNPLFTQQGTGDPMGPNNGNRIGDRITVRGLMIRAMFELPLGRSKTHFKIFLVKKARNDTLDRATFFRGDTDNKMLDLINTERYTIVASKYFTISTSNPAPTSLVPNINGVPTAGTPAGIGTRIIKMWVPGRKFGRGGNVTYEDGSSVPKFFDYRIVCMAYDWYGTPQDLNEVGKVNELLTKLYFKDA